jgi:epoxide hydrolase-like predicted phosphatase
MNGIKNIIFDLGGVIINLNVNKTISEFNKLTSLNFEDIYTQANQVELFDLFDKGKISIESFFTQLKQKLNFDGNIEYLIDAWNSMILDIPEDRLDTLVNAKQNYNTFLLSNTNESHIKVFESDLYSEYGVKNFEDYFDKLYYSCRIGLRKPDKEIFEYVLTKNKLNPSETVFIDDSIQHVKSAGECGINAFLLEPNMEVNDLLKSLNLL